ncbi:hypothetical protein [Paraburkholderia sp. GAS334]|uniref:hypothetical protein n=1 Tax=Paraburkholderia sp. GAS334 TaxID=3035131 RepID=UPI003D23E53D
METGENRHKACIDAEPITSTTRVRAREGSAHMSKADERLKSWGDFMRAVHEAKRGNYRSAREIVERVRARSGDAAVAMQRRELWRVIQAGKAK